MSGKLGACAGALLALCLTAASRAQTAQPSVMAAWSQAFGVAAPEEAVGLIAPKVEMRFVLDAGADCGAFDVEFRTVAGPAWRAAPEKARSRTSGRAATPLGVEVCAVEMTSGGADWRAGRLRWNGGPAVLTSRLVLGDSADTVGSGSAPGPADGAEIILAGGGAVGAAREDGALLVATLGDTGCRGVPRSAAKTSPTPAEAAQAARMRQDCDPASWPLAALAAAGAARRPDLVVHVGDYRYFLEDEVPRPADPWLFWRKDFFPAMQPLLLAAPLVAARGNHESCGDWGFGDGYFQLFGPGGVAGCDGAADPMPPAAFDVAPAGLAAGADAAHRFVVLDTNDDAAAGLTDRYREAMALTRAPGAPGSAWWITHVPAIVLVDYEGAEHTGDPDLQADLLAAPGAGSLGDWFCGGAACRPSQILLGHQHLFQTLEFPAGGRPGARWVLPRHVVVGHGGTKIDDASPAPAGAARCRYDGFAALAPPGGAAPAALAETRAAHGLVLWRRGADTLALPSGWAMEPLWAAGAEPPADPAAAAPPCDLG